ncbi:hypothetical protein E2C01_097106 [Portunus trituberculatus]|uniref:Uncharacterized protein n=1 Tax=Portunus trituberculatus TaxID=210409 RepID=A0A5B7JUA9_PORTR|nr:hypothetical protein [Portunus trituberculatus]
MKRRIRKREEEEEEEEIEDTPRLAIQGYLLNYNHISFGDKLIILERRKTVYLHWLQEEKEKEEEEEEEEEEQEQQQEEEEEDLNLVAGS